MVFPGRILKLKEGWVLFERRKEPSPEAHKEASQNEHTYSDNNRS